MAQLQTLFVEGDTAPNLTGTVTSGGVAVNLAGATVVLRMQRPDKTMLLRSATVTDAATGAWAYAWQAGELTAGLWWVDVETTWSDASLQTSPSDISIAFKVRARRSGAAGSVVTPPMLNLDLSNLTGMDAAVAAKVSDPASVTSAALSSRYVKRVTGLVPNDQTAGVKASNAAILTAALVPNSPTIVPRGNYYTDPISVMGPVDLRGEDITTTLRNDSGSVLVLTGNQVNVSNITLRSDGGGHTVQQSGVVDQGHWRNFRIYQTSDSYSIWDSAGYGMVEMRFRDFLSWHTQTATVPSWKIVSAGGAINGNTWASFRAQFSGNYHFWVESTTANSQYADTWRDVTWEVTTGGMIKLIGCRDYLIENSTVWDLALGAGGLTTLKRHGIHADTNGSSAGCVGTIRNHRRLDSACDAGIQDIMLPSSFRGDGTVLENCRNITPANPLMIDINTNVSRVLIDGPTASSLATIINATTAHIVDRTGITLPATQAFKIGANSLVGFGLAQVNVVADPASIPAGAELDVVLAVTGALSTDACSVSPGFYLDPGLGIVGCWTGANTVTFRLRNFTASAVDSASHTWRVRVWR